MASVASIAVFSGVAAARFSYPYELEWLEGWMVDSISQILDGRPLYGPPSLEFLPAVYNPVYFYTAAAFSWVMGVDFAAARLVSVLSTIGLLALLVFRLQPSARTAGLVAAGLYAASYRMSGAWMDLARNDSLFLVLLVGAFLIGRDSKSRWQDIICGAGYALAFYTKQTALAVLVVLFAGQLFVDWRRYWIQWLTFGVTASVAFVTLDWMSDGWYSYYTLDSAWHFVPNPDRLYFLAHTRLKLLPELLATTIIIATMAAQRWWPGLVGQRETRVDAATWSTLILAVALAASSWAVFRQRGTFDNVFMPACLGLAIGAGIAYDSFRRGISAHQSSPAVDGNWQWLGFGAVAVLILQQFTLLAYNPIAQVPTAVDRAAGDALISRLHSLPGDVLVWAHGHIGSLAGKGRHVSDMAFTDAAGLESEPPRSEDNRRHRQLALETVVEGIHRQAFDWVLIDRESDLWAPYYVPLETISNAPRMLTGRDTRITWVLAKNPIPRGGRLDPTDPHLSFLFGSGWGPPTESGRWLIGKDATVTLALESGVQYQLQLGLRTPCSNEAGGTTVSVWWNSTLLAQKTAECSAEPFIAMHTLDSIERGANTLRLSAAPEGASLSLTSVNVIPTGR